MSRLGEHVGTVGVGDRSYDRQAQPVAMVGVGRAAFGEAGEEPVDLGCVDHRSGVGDPQHRLVVVFADVNREPAPVMVVDDRVADQVRDEPFERDFVAEHGGVAEGQPQVEMTAIGLGGKVAGDVADDVGQVDRAVGVRPVLDLGEVKKLTDDTVSALDVVDERRGELPLPVARFGVGETIVCL